MIKHKNVDTATKVGKALSILTYFSNLLHFWMKLWIKITTCLFQYKINPLKIFVFINPMMIHWNYFAAQTGRKSLRIIDADAKLPFYIKRALTLIFRWFFFLYGLIMLWRKALWCGQHAGFHHCGLICFDRVSFSFSLNFLP